jgi:putative endonuclease
MGTRRDWFLYVVECADGTLYTGISTDVSRRVAEHNAGRGARYTASRRPVYLQAIWRFRSRKNAMRAEISFKRKNRAAKERAIAAEDGFRGGSWLPTD